MKIKLGILFVHFVFLANPMISQDSIANYRRSSIYSILVNHTEQKFASEIKEAFLQIPVPDKFNDHNLSVKVVNLQEKLSNATKNKENEDISEFLEANKIASRLVGRWFNRDFFTGECNMELIKERGIYNASEFDKQIAMRSARGYAMLQDAGEELIGNTFVLVNDIRYVDKSKKAKTTSSVFRALGSIASIATGINIDNLTDNLGDLIETIKGFSVRINTFLYKLEWDDDIAMNFYQEQYLSEQNETKRLAFENNRQNYKLKYVGKVESRGGSVSFMGINEDEPIVMVRKACQRALDENVVDLQREYEEFRASTPLLSVEPITAYIGKKEGVAPGVRFEVLETVELEDGSHKYNKVGELEPIENLIWDNRYMADEEGAVGASLGYTTFKVVKGKDFSKGMLIREMKTK